MIPQKRARRKKIRVMRMYSGRKLKKRLKRLQKTWKKRVENQRTMQVIKGSKKQLLKNRLKLFLNQSLWPSLLQPYQVKKLQLA